MALYLKLSGATGNRQSNMAAAKPEVVIYYLVDYIESKFQRLPPETPRCIRNSPKQCGSRLTGSSYISPCRLHRIEISTPTPTYSESRNSQKRNSISVIHKHLQKLLYFLLYKYLIIISSSCTFNVSFCEIVSESVTKPLVRFPFFLFVLAATCWHCRPFNT